MCYVCANGGDSDDDYDHHEGPSESHTAMAGHSGRCESNSRTQCGSSPTQGTPQHGQAGDHDNLLRTNTEHTSEYAQVAWLQGFAPLPEFENVSLTKRSEVDSASNIALSESSDRCDGPVRHSRYLRSDEKKERQSDHQSGAVRRFSAAFALESVRTDAPCRESGNFREENRETDSYWYPTENKEPSQTMSKSGSHDQPDSSFQSGHQSGAV